jgi:hypothetical protein
LKNQFMVILFFCIVLMCLAANSDAQNDIQALINAAIKNGESSVTIPAGTYPTGYSNSAGAHVEIKNVKNLTVNATGVVMICKKRASAFAIENCENLTINGFTIDYDPMLYTQGSIVSATSNWSSIDVQIHDGYPTEGITKSKIEVYDAATRLLKDNVWTLYDAPVSKSSSNIFTISNTSGFSGKVDIGDMVVLYYSASAHGIRITSCQNSTLTNMTVHAAPVFGVLELNCENITYDKVDFTLGPTPAGATEARLNTATADGIHSISSPVGPTIKNCTFENLGDDAVAIHGEFHYAVLSDGTTLGINLKYNRRFMSIGETIAGVNNAGERIFTATLEDIRDPSSSEQGEMEDIWNSISGDLRDPGIFRGFVILELDQSVSVEPGTSVYIVERQGDGFIVQDNIIRNKRARGILIKASDGLIDNNVIEWNGMGGIVISPEFYWMESGPSKNITISNNTLKDCWMQAEHWGASQAGAICITAAKLEGGFSPAGIQNDITISNNVMDGCYGVQILTTSANNILIENNIMSNWKKRNHGANLGLSGTYMVWLENCDNVRLSNNQVDCLGGEKMVRVKNASNITGELDGVFCTDSNVDSKSSMAPLEFKLDQNYPNPFNPQTTIIYHMPNRTAVRIILYNLAGKEVETLVDDVVDPGDHSVVWNAGNFASGVYFYKIIAESFVDSKKMLILK